MSAPLQTNLENRIPLSTSKKVSIHKEQYVDYYLSNYERVSKLYAHIADEKEREEKIDKKMEYFYSNEKERKVEVPESTTPYEPSRPYPFPPFPYPPYIPPIPDINPFPNPQPFPPRPGIYWV